MSENKITFPVKLASNNPQSFGIVDAIEVSGHKSVDTLSDLYAISDPVLSVLKDGSYAIGQEWFVVSEDCKYRLDNWANRKSVAGWTKLPKQEFVNTKQSVSEKDQPNGYAGLDSNGKLPIEKTYGATATVTEVETYESLPVTGLSGVIYYVSNTSAQYKWSGSAYIDITDGADNAKKNETSIFDCSNGTSTKYYSSLLDAINIVPPVYRTSNRIISYLSTENATTKAVNYQYNGIDSTTWTDLTKWERVPNQSDLAEIRSDLNEKVDVEEGKSLIPDQFVEQSENPEFIQVLVDADRRMIESTTPTGKKTFYGDVVIKGKDVLEEIDKKVNEENGKSLISTQFIQEIESPEYIECHTDNNKRVLYGVDKDGDFVFGCSVPKQIQKYVLNAASSNKIIRNNILFRKRYINTSNNVEEVIDVTERKYANMVAIGVFSSDYLTSNKKYNVYGSFDGSTYTSLSSNINTNIVYELTVDLTIKYIKIITTNISSNDSLNIGINVWSECNDFKILVAASDSSNEIFKREAHFICDGVNDEVELDEAVVFSSQTSIISLSNGAFYIDSFIEKTYKSPADGETGPEYTDYGVITNFSRNFFASQRTIVGIDKSTNNWGKGTRIYVRESAFTGLPNDVEPYVIGCPKYGTTGELIIKHLDITVENNQHKVVCINGQRLGAMIVDSVYLSAGANAWSETLPVEGCVGLRGVMGDCNGTNYYIAHTYSIAFYEGFQLGGEHLVMIECGGRFNYYCYTFGNYDYGSAYNSGQVTVSHPLTLINCCDEGSRALPKFVKSGMYSDGDVAGKQQIDLIGFNMEVHTASLQGAVEVTPGAFCGTIDFVAYGNTNTSKNTPGPERRNRVDIRFWASDNDGKYFRTTNATHSEQGSSSERLGYWAQKMQKYYDTDLNKMLVCTNEANQTWRDFSGNLINN